MRSSYDGFGPVTVADGVRRSTFPFFGALTGTSDPAASGSFRFRLVSAMATTGRFTFNFGVRTMGPVGRGRSRIRRGTTGAGRAATGAARGRLLLSISDPGARYIAFHRVATEKSSPEAQY